MLLIIYGHTDHPDIAFSYNNMASVYRSQGNYSKALQYHEKSLKMRLAVHQTAPHSDIFNSYLSLGDVSMSLFNFSSAVRYYQQSLCTLQLLSCDEKQLDSLRSMTDWSQPSITAGPVTTSNIDPLWLIHLYNMSICFIVYYFIPNMHHMVNVFQIL